MSEIVLWDSEIFAVSRSILIGIIRVVVTLSLSLSDFRLLVVIFSAKSPGLSSIPSVVLISLSTSKETIEIGRELGLPAPMSYRTRCPMRLVVSGHGKCEQKQHGAICLCPKNVHQPWPLALNPLLELATFLVFLGNECNGRI